MIRVTTSEGRDRLSNRLRDISNNQLELVMQETGIKQARLAKMGNTLKADTEWRPLSDLLDLLKPTNH